jgi:hypothetical protein
MKTRPSNSVGPSARHRPIESSRDAVPESNLKAIEEDLRLQPDPELELSGGRATTGQIVVTTLVALTVIGAVLYAVTRDSTEAERTAKTLNKPVSSVAPPANSGLR